MAKQKKEINTASRKSPRESDNPIVEEFKEDLLQKPSFASQSVNRLTSNEGKLERMESLLAELLQKMDALERRVQILESDARK